MKLIIAEKPMLVAAIAEAIPGQKTLLAGSTYMTKGEYTLISVFGHLLTLKEPEDYDEKYADRKDISLLPIYFDDWQMKVKPPDEKHKDSPPEQRLNEIGRLLKQCEYVIHAGDPDEEGQLLIDEVLRWFHYTGKTYRLDTLTRRRMPCGMLWLTCMTIRAMRPQAGPPMPEVWRTPWSGTTCPDISPS